MTTTKPEAPATPATATLTEAAKNLDRSIRAAASQGESFDRVERVTLAQVMAIGAAAMQLYVASQGQGGLGDSLENPRGNTADPEQ
jgi:hypothetical protein